jgi:hypothetical protein
MAGPVPRSHQKASESSSSYGVPSKCSAPGRSPGVEETMRSHLRKRMTLAISATFLVSIVAGLSASSASPVMAVTSHKSASALAGDAQISDAGMSLPSDAVSLRISEATQLQLLRLYAGYRRLPVTDIARVILGSVHGARISSTGREWAMMALAPSTHTPESAAIGFQDGGSIGIFTRSRAGNWKISGLGGEPIGCNRLLSRPVRQLWRIASCPVGISPRPTSPVRPDLTTRDV